MVKAGFDFEAVRIGVRFINGFEFVKQRGVFSRGCIADNSSPFTTGEFISTFRVLTDVGIAKDLPIVSGQGWEKGNHFVSGFIDCDRGAFYAVIGGVAEDYGKDWAWADVAKGNPIKEGFAHGVGGIMESVVGARELGHKVEDDGCGLVIAPAGSAGSEG
jgi:hypothetical protein